MRHRVVSSIKKRLHFTMTFVCEQDVWKLIWTLHKFSQWAHFGTRKIYSFGSELRHISDPCCVICCDAIEEKCVFLFTRFDRCCQSDVRGSLTEVCIALTALLVRFADVVYLSYIDLHHLHFLQCLHYRLITPIAVWGRTFLLAHYHKLCRTEQLDCATVVMIVLFRLKSVIIKENGTKSAEDSLTTKA